MKRLPILFSIVLLVVSGVAAQEKLKGQCRIAGAPVPATPVGQQPLPECPPEPLSLNFPDVPDLIMKEFLVKRDGTVFTLEEFRGTVIVLNLWATWAGPVRSDMPHLLEMQEKYKSDGLKVIAVNIGDGTGTPENESDIAKFSERFKINFELVQEVNPSKITDAVYELTKFSGIPQSILIDREGKLRGVFLGGGDKVSEKRKETVDKLMNEK